MTPEFQQSLLTDIRELVAAHDKTTAALQAKIAELEDKNLLITKALEHCEKALTDADALIKAQRKMIAHRSF